eukprot:scaffold23325_cov127-Isochrysis_galbana.AAC.1
MPEGGRRQSLKAARISPGSGRAEMLRARRVGRIASALRRGLSSGNESGDFTGAEFKFLKPLDARHSDGWDILNNPLWNKGTAFSRSERDALGLRGLLPHHMWTITEQVESFMGRLSEIDDKPLMQNLMLQDLQSRNETLFHRVLVEHIEKTAPLVYTPTVGVACQQFSNRYQRPRGMFFTPDDAGHMGVMMHNWPRESCQ